MLRRRTFQDITNETIILNEEKEENFNLLYLPYEDISNKKFENEIEEPPPNTQEDSSLVIDDETSQEKLQREELMEEMHLQKNDEQHHPYKKEESFQDIFDESRTLEVVINKEKDINISYTPYEEEIKESPPKLQNEFSQNKEELVEEKKN